MRLTLVIDPKRALVDGVQILAPLLQPNGFHFQFRGEGKGSGGEFAWGEFVRDERKLGLHFRWSLGLVRYHVADQSASHESYMRELGVWDQCRYPTFSEDPAAPFHGLAHDLGWGNDFLSGSAAILRRAAVKEAVEAANRREELMSRYVGDVAKLEELHRLFREGRYRDVVALAEELTYPSRMSESERMMVDIARRKTND